jgi:hypothetical protein
VEIWRELLRRETSPGVAPIEISWPDCTRATPLPVEQIGAPQPAPFEEPARAESVIAPWLDMAFPDEAPFARSSGVPVPDRVLGLRMDIASMEQRYPLLRNAL